MIVRNIVRAVLFLTLAASQVNAQPVVYRLIDIASPSVATFSFGINDSGVVIGLIVVQGESGKETRAVRSVNDGFVIPPGLDRASSALGVNTNGDLTGNIVISPWPSNEYHAIRYTDAGGVEDISTGYDRAEGWAINRFGQVAGWLASGSGSHAFVSEPSGLRDLGTLGGVSAVATGINDAGTVVGASALSDGTNEAFIAAAGGTMRSLGIPMSAARGINNHEQIAGSIVGGFYSHPFRFTPGVGLENLDPEPYRNSEAYAINDLGSVVGRFQLPNTWVTHAFVYSDAEGFVDLNTRIMDGGEGWTVLRPTGINNRGEISAQAIPPGGLFERAVKLVPADLLPPTITSASADSSSIWPPDRRMVAVTVSASATDDRDPAPHCSIDSVAITDESFDVTDAQITGALSLLLRAERTGHDEAGRTYEITILCSDSAGNRATTTVNVSVPRDAGAEK